MTVLQAIEQGLRPMSLTEIAAAADMGASKAHRYLVSLCRVGLVAQSQRSGLYDLGPGMRRLGIEALRRMDEVGLATEYLPTLRDRTSHSVNLAAWGDNGPVIVRWDYGAYALPITVRVGATMPLLTSSVGRIYLAYLPRTMTDPVLGSQLALQGEASPTSEEIEQIRTSVHERGLAVTSGGVIPGVASVAAPVFPAGESIPLALAVALPERLADDKTMTDIEYELLRITEEITADLGGAAGARSEA
ncbi:transcriptional regulator, IclR family [Haloechinothrix alba]|uniref:Transcriptional regulator, IclR family n=2 Tax=Haloechinothrix alba TaxID=664784 RepID=A0A238YXI7_9PSEU|nr:transcriptional regulator, IclR family [Haloechinothrix alba]